MTSVFHGAHITVAERREWRQTDREGSKEGERDRERERKRKTSFPL